MRTCAGIVLGAALLSACAGVSSEEADLDQLPVIQIKAHRWAYEPDSITLQQGVPVVLELQSDDVQHGFNVPGLGIRSDVLPDSATRLRVVPSKPGTFPFHCDYFCGAGHEGMEGQIIVR